MDNKDINSLIAVSHERIKELAAINQTVGIIKEGKSVEETLQKICNLLPKAWQYPEHAISRIVFDSLTYTSTKDFFTSKWHQIQDFTTIDGKRGSIEICYTKEFPLEDEGPFLMEERNLIINLANILAGFINTKRGSTLITSQPYKDELTHDKEEYRSEQQLLHEFLRKNNASRYLYHDLMPFRVKEILLVATLYNVFNLELEGALSSRIFSEYYDPGQSAIPRVTGVSSYEEAINQMNYKHFDLIIIMLGADKEAPFSLCEKIKSRFPYIPVYLLLNYSHEAMLLPGITATRNGFDRIFTWNGNSKVFFAMVKHLEDISNVENDTNIGLVNIILLVEDSSEYYSSLIPVIYDNIINQTQKLIDEKNSNEFNKHDRLRARPKLLLATNYEEALFLYKKYKDYLLCVISDVELDINDNTNKQGLSFVEEIRKSDTSIPVILNSSEEKYQQEAFKLNAIFLNKNSESLLSDINSFINYHLGFGSFIFKTAKEKKIVRAASLKEFEQIIHTIPVNSLVYHGRKLHYSLWLRSKGEIEIARQIHDIDPDSFEDAEDYRKCIIDLLNKYIHEKQRGHIVIFDRESIIDSSNIVSLVEGLMGGKGRGLAFVNNLINNLDFSKIIDGINIVIPLTYIIGSDEFDLFLIRNNIQYDMISDAGDQHIKELFFKGQLSDKLMKRLEIIVKEVRKPLAFRSSGLMEDSINQPFAGIFETYILPNNQVKITERLEMAAGAVKLVFASVFTSIARNYLKAINAKIESEKMAIIVQEVVGNEYEGYFYPHISGVAQSYNYYPVSHMQPEDGFALLALGLGKYVVEGEKTYRFSPYHPEIEISSVKDQVKNSQTQFFAVDMKKSKINLLDGDCAGLARLDIYDAENHGTLKHLASVYDRNSEIIKAGLDNLGPRVLNFANILKYNYIPLAEAIGSVLKITENALGCPAEIEFAVNLNKNIENKASFYLLQIKPLLGNIHDHKINIDEIDPKKTLIYAERGMGNGIIENIDSVIFIAPDSFNKFETEEMAAEIEELNNHMISQNKKYILIGPGRWGTRDKWIGIPVNWPQISNAQVIIEYSMPDFPLDASLGSHFFHNVTANNIAYFSVIHNTKSFINWNILEKQKQISSHKYFRHIKFKKPLKIMIDGKKRIALVSIDDNPCFTSDCSANFSNPSDELQGELSETSKLLLNSCLENGKTNLKIDDIICPGCTEHWKWRYKVAEKIAAELNKKDFGVKAVYLIGSTKNANAGPASDIDLMVHFTGSESQKDEMINWISEWSICLAEVNKINTGITVENGLIDLHIITDRMIAEKDSFASMIGSYNNSARLLKN